MKSKVNELTWTKILVYLNSNGFNETINNSRGLPKIKSFSRDEIKLCENVLLNKKYPIVLQIRSPVLNRFQTDLTYSKLNRFDMQTGFLITLFDVNIAFFS